MERLNSWVSDLPSMIRHQSESLLLKNPPDFYTEHKNGRLPVILVPGIFEHWGIFKKIADAVSYYGQHNVFTVPGLLNNTYGINRSAEIVEYLIRTKGIQDPILLAHSKGALIGKMVLIDGMAQRMIAISAPFSGTNLALAKYNPFTGIKELSVKSQIILDLAEDKSINNKIISIFPEEDNLIPNGSFLEEADNISVPVKGHHKLLDNIEVISFIIIKLKLWELEKQQKCTRFI